MILLIEKYTTDVNGTLLSVSQWQYIHKFTGSLVSKPKHDSNDEQTSTLLRME